MQMNLIATGRIVAIDMHSAFRDLPGFTRSVDAALAAVKALPRANPDQEILFPGERGGRSATQRGETGISIPPKLWAQLEKAATELGVALP